MFFSIKTQFINNCSIHEKIFLSSIYLEIKETGFIETNFEKVNFFFFILVLF